MFVDASALVAILTLEDGAASLAERLDRAPQPITSAIAVYEAVAAIIRKSDMTVGQAEKLVQEFLVRAAISVTTIGIEEQHAALVAFGRFGKGRHPAKLNMGDCFAYACARTHGVPLLFKGNDFP